MLQGADEGGALSRVDDLHERPPHASGGAGDDEPHIAHRILQNDGKKTARTTLGALYSEATAICIGSRLQLRYAACHHPVIWPAQTRFDRSALVPPARPLMTAVF